MQAPSRAGRGGHSLPIGQARSRKPAVLVVRAGRSRLSFQQDPDCGRPVVREYGSLVNVRRILRGIALLRGRERLLMDVLNLPRPGWMTEELALLEQQVRRFIAAEYVPHLDRWNEQGMYERDVWNKAGAAGLLCPSIPEAYGGPGGSFAHEAVIGRELSLAGFDSFGAGLHSGIVAPYILHYGTDEQKRRWLPKLVTGKLVGAIAMSEPGSGSDLQGVRTSAAKSGNGYLLNGSKTFITNGQHANLIVVVAKTDASAGAKGVALMVLETEDAMGFRRGRKLKKLGLDSADTSELFFEDVKLPGENLLGRDEGQGFAQLMTDLPRERLIVAVHAQAMIERALALTLDYVKQRQAFGKKIIEFQNTQLCWQNANRRPPSHGCFTITVSSATSAARSIPSRLRWQSIGLPTCR